MCGISGFYSLDKEINLDKYYKAHLLLKHRGPDDEGFAVMANHKMCCARGDDTIENFKNLAHIRSFGSSRLVIGHRRLSIIDLTWRGHQPMNDEDERFWFVSNGEIYNYIELRKDLERLGYSFKSSSDSEVFLTAFKEWGVDSFNKFNGMWAAVIYDKMEDKLILIRDRFGIKPLFYFIKNNSVYFSSEVKFLLQFMDKPEINEQIASEYILFCLLDHVSETMFKDIYQLEPGHYAEFVNGAIQTRQYWKYLPKINKNMAYKTAIEELDRIFRSSVDLRMRSDVPVGSLLSGGIDSTAIVCDLHRRGKIRENNFNSFSAVFKEEEFSEKSYIEKTVGKIGCIPHYVYPDPDKVEDEIKNILYYQEFPFRSLSVYSQWCLYKHIKKETPVVVLLNGQGGDEIFGGYTSHYNSLISEHLRTFKFLTAIKEAKQYLKYRAVNIVDMMILTARTILPNFTDLLMHIIKYHSKFLKKSFKFNKSPKYSNNYFLQDTFSNLMFSAIREYLRYEDRDSMAFSLETRLPFMDFNLIEFGYTLPDDYKIKDGINKRILRDFARGFTTKEAVERTDKMGFVSPQEKWQKTLLKGYTNRIITKKNIEDNFPFLDGKRIISAYNNYLKGRNKDWSFFWRICCLFEWKKLWIDKGGEIEK